MIRSSKHSLKFLNYDKKTSLEDFLEEYRRVGGMIIDSIWECGYENFSIAEDKLSFPQFIDYKKFDIETTLSARALSSLVTQVSGVIRAVVEKRKRGLWLLEKLKDEGKNTLKFEEKFEENYKMSKPRFSNAKAELSSKCADVISTDGKFEYFLQLKSLGDFDKIRIPIQGTAVSKKWLVKGKLMNSFLIGDKDVNLRFTVEKSEPKGSQIVGADQGLKTITTFSDGQATPDKDKDGHSFESILDRMSRKQKGSKSFKRAQAHRKNFINWSLNQIDFSDFKEIRLEKVWNINYKRKRSRKMSHWTNTLIRDKIKNLAEEAEVPLLLQDSSFMSQRCFGCGLVKKANRKRKTYECECTHCCDADLNASLNHSIDLPDASHLRGQGLNITGFYWKPEGFFDVDGQELRVPDSTKKE